MQKNKATYWRNSIRSVWGLRDQQGVICALYLLVITSAEAVTTMANAYWGMFFHSVVLVILLIHGSLVQRGIQRRFLILLTLAPLIRILSLSIPLAKLGLPVIYWYMVIGALLFIAAFVAGRVTDLKGQRIGWSWKHWPVQIVMGLSGFGLGFVEFKILNPGPVAAYITWVDVLVASFILLVFTGILEEYIFRGLMQSASMQLMGIGGMVYIAVLFCVLHLGYHSFADLVFVLAVGLFFGWWVWKTQSLIGASLSHGIANISLYVIFPFLIGPGSLPVSSSSVVAASPTSIAASVNTHSPVEKDMPPTDTLVDNGDPGFVHMGGELWLDTTDGYRNSFLWIFSAQSNPEVVVTWIPVMYGCGRYRVDVFIPQGNGLTESAHYSVHHRGGTTDVELNQSEYRGGWAFLGNYEFDMGRPAYIQLSNWTGEDQKLLRWVSFDAIRWVLSGACSTAFED
jgi:membrane protease YdiL (CAAX protease family)